MRLFCDGSERGQSDTTPHDQDVAHRGSQREALAEWPERIEQVTRFKRSEATGAGTGDFVEKFDPLGRPVDAVHAHRAPQERSICSKRGAAQMEKLARLSVEGG